MAARLSRGLSQIQFRSFSILVSPQWVQQNAGKPKVKIVDASFYMPAEKQDPFGNWVKKRVPGSIFFDIDKVVDKNTNLPHMLPSPEDFASALQDLGITREDHVVFYDQKGIFSSPRGWWTFLAFGYPSNQVSVLDGGLPGFELVGGKLESGEPKKKSKVSVPVKEKRGDWVVDAKYMKSLVDEGKQSKTQIIDARSAARFQGTQPEPRAGLKSGHIPFSLNIPFTNLLTNKNPYSNSKNSDAAIWLKQGDELRQEYTKIGVKLDQNSQFPIVTTCGSGVTAAILTLGLHVLGYKNTRLYDGSWSEWGGLPNVPVSTNP